MRVCVQCNGEKYVVANNRSIQTYLGSNTFTAPTQTPAVACNYCNGTGIDTGAGS